MVRRKLLFSFVVPLACLSPRAPQGTALQTSVEVLASTFAPATDLGSVAQVVPVTLRNFPPLNVGDVSLAVFAQGMNVTDATTINHTVAWEYPNPDDPNHIVRRLDIFEVLFGSPLASSLSAGDSVTYTATVAVTAQPVTASGTTLLVGGGAAALEDDACVKACVCNFVAAVGATKTGGVTSLGAAGPDDPGTALSDAEAALRNCLNQCEPPVTELKNDAAFECPNPGGPPGSTLRVRIIMRPDGIGSADATLSAGDADLIIAIGGNADAGSSGRGGNASATNTTPGGAAIAVAGNGGNAGSGGAGGNATSTASGTNAGDSVAVAGNGGNAASSGGAGGEATATTTNSASTATSEGGNGGDPGNNATTGGAGGDADAFRGTPPAQSHEHHDGGATSPGKHGTGANSSSAGFPPIGPNSHGVSVNNV